MLSINSPNMNLHCKKKKRKESTVNTGIVTVQINPSAETKNHCVLYSKTEPAIYMIKSTNVIAFSSVRNTMLQCSSLSTEYITTFVHHAVTSCDCVM